jgi:hypothetical protein
LNPNHPSLAFKRLNTSVPLYSARISLSHRVVARLQGDSFVWFFIGGHDDYMRVISTIR